MKNSISVLLSLFMILTGKAQVTDTCAIPNKTADQFYIDEVQDSKATDKVLHAEPLFIDLIRDLGARKGEREWNVGMGINDNSSNDNYTYLIEYEFAPIDRLGLEVELPVTVYASKPDGSKRQSTELNSIKVAGQYSYYVSEKNKTSMAIGYIHEFTLAPLNTIRQNAVFNGNVFNPFLVFAKRWGNNFHTLYYGGPYIHTFFDPVVETSFEYQHNYSIHYMIPGTRNFLGIELNHVFINSRSEMVMRPQMRISIADNLMIGIVTGIPLQKGNERLSSFFRIIYEPSHKHK